MIRIILNGKKAGVDSVRAAISTFREEVEGVEVIDPNDTAAQKVVKAKVVQGDHRKRKVKRNVR